LTPKADLCSFLNLSTAIQKEGIDSVKLPGYGVFNNTMVKNILEGFYQYHEKYVPGGISTCPVNRDYFKIYNYSSSIKNEFEKILPNGDYRYEHRIWNGQDDNIFTKTVYERFKTMEDSFI
jgi:hypothetical protein